MAHSSTIFHSRSTEVAQPIPRLNNSRPQVFLFKHPADLFCAFATVKLFFLALFIMFEPATCTDSYHGKHWKHIWLESGCHQTKLVCLNASWTNSKPHSPRLFSAPLLRKKADKWNRHSLGHFSFCKSNSILVESEVRVPMHPKDIFF